MNTIALLLIIAQAATLSWTNPAENNDGSPYTNQSETRIYAGCQRSGQYELPVLAAPHPATTIIYDGLPVAPACYFTATAVNQDGIESVFSNEAVKTFPVNAPGPPTLTIVWSESQEPPPMALTPVLTDNFNRADQFLSASADWDQINFYFGANIILGNQLASGPAGAAPPGDIVTATHDPDQYAQAVLTEANQVYGGDRFNSLAVRCVGLLSGAGTDSIQCYAVNISGNYDLTVVKYDAGTITTLYTGGGVSQNDEIRIEVTGTTTTQIDVYINDVLEDAGSGFTAQDTTSPFTTGVPGIGVRSPYAWDDWESGDVTAGAGSDDLLADDLESDSELTTPTVGQAHDLTSTDVESASSVTAPTLSELAALTADDVESASELSVPDFAQIHDLTAVSLESASELTTPAISSNADLSTDNLESASELTTPAISSNADLSTDNLESASEVSAPTLGQVHDLSAVSIESTSELTEPGTSGSATLEAVDLESATEVTTPTISQVHDLSAVGAESASEVTAPTADEITAGINAEDVEAASELTEPSIAQAHDLSADSVESTSNVTAPSLNQAATPILADDIESATEVSQPALGQVVALFADDLEATTEITTPTFGQLHGMLALSLEAQSEISATAVNSTAIRTIIELEAVYDRGIDLIAVYDRDINL